jgi:hypothetical protein
MDTNEQTSVEESPTKMSNTRRARKTIIVTCAIVALALVLLSCAPRQSGSVDIGNNSDEDSAGIAENEMELAFEWSEDSDCGVCHGTEAHSFENSTTAAFFHASKECIDCHDEADALVKVHEGTTPTDLMPKRLKRTAVKEEVCLECHVQSTLAQDSAANEALTDSVGTTVNPHQLPKTTSGIHEEIVCADCHELHNDETGLEKSAKDYCLSCHHADVFECYTCHQER